MVGNELVIWQGVKLAFALSKAGICLKENQYEISNLIKKLSSQRCLKKKVSLVGVEFYQRSQVSDPSQFRSVDRYLSRGVNQKGT